MAFQFQRVRVRHGREKEEETAKGSHLKSKVGVRSTLRVPRSVSSLRAHPD